MYQIVTNGCPKGWAFVRDYQGNKIFYGPIKDCMHCIDVLLGLVKEDEDAEEVVNGKGN